MSLIDLMMIFLLFFSPIHADDCNGNDYGTAGIFDFYVFQQTWPAEYCYGSTSAGCLDPTPYMKTSLTIHGLWPNYATEHDGHWWPQCCPSIYGSVLKQDVIDKLIDDLRLYWPDENGIPWPDYTNSSFWQHEWGKHGTCDGHDQYTYMSSAIYKTQLNCPTPALIQDNIGGNVSKSALQAIYNNGSPCVSGQPCMVNIGCKGGKYILSMTTCWTRSYEKMLCPVEVLGNDTCTSSDLIIAGFISKDDTNQIII